MAALDWENINLAPATETEYTLLPPGEYGFTVIALERGMHIAKAGGKLGDCPKADITIAIHHSAGDTSLRERLFLDDSCLVILSSFFNSIGCYESVTWDIEGKEGCCRVKNREYEGKKYNTVDRWLPAPQDAKAAALSAF
jgi:hypothetical protein